MYAYVTTRDLTDIARWRVGYLCAGRTRYVSIYPSIFILTLSGTLSLVVTLGDVPSVTCNDVSFLMVSDKFSNDFKYSITGDGKDDAGNGFLSALVSSMADLVARYFGNKDGN